MGFFIDCLGASREVGRSAFLVRTDKKIMLDYGIKIFDKSGFPKFPLESVNPDFIVLSHAHLDHSGCLPSFYRNSKVRWYATPPTRDICEILWQDSMKIMGDGLPYRKQHFKKALKYWTPLLYDHPIETGGTTVEFLDAGHISGSAIVNIGYEGKKIVYSGDFKGENTYMHKGAESIEDVDVLIMETTYAQREHPPRKKLEANLMHEVYETLDDGGNALLPAFAVGRTQELISLLRHHDKEIPIFVDGMGRDITKIYMKHPRYIREAQSFRKAVRSVNIVENISDKKKASRTPSVIIAGAGMLNGGAILNYLYHANKNSKLIFTGYCVEDTNGWLLLNKGYIMKDEQELQVDLPVEYFDLSAHAGRSDIMSFIEKANPEKIILVHGDKPEKFAQELKEEHGYDAIAPLIGERIEIH
ncbi:MBL fold metallo-hydrolase [Candidatus Micrarchaeota archaeon]|nr:MBL fold metallo-hydrolase [Candidatus Micrarchaeota archaeon]